MIILQNKFILSKFVSRDYLLARLELFTELSSHREVQICHDAHQYELFCQSVTSSFFVTFVTWRLHRTCHGSKGQPVYIESEITFNVEPRK